MGGLAIRLKGWKRVVEILTTAFPYSKLGGYFPVQPSEGRIFCCMAPGRQERQTLAISTWSKGSKVEFWKGSHKLSVQPAKGTLMELSREQVAKQDSVTLDIEDGGL